MIGCFNLLHYVYLIIVVSTFYNGAYITGHLLFFIILHNIVQITTVTIHYPVLNAITKENSNIASIAIMPFNIFHITITGNKIAHSPHVNIVQILAFWFQCFYIGGGQRITALLGISTT